tara:strand:- start:424 stop:1347 length:924 start_codon:yes stop_codon:yes gene_type:complete
MKIYINKANESWIVDRLISEWQENNQVLTSKSLFFSDIVWIISPWTWRWKLNPLLKNKKIVCTIHHFDERDLEPSNILLFKKRDRYVDAYHVLNAASLDQIQKLTKKPVYMMPFWINQDIFYPIHNKEKLKETYHLSKKEFLIGSFQRDTEGKDLKSPKLIKGPDRFVEIVSSLSKKHSNLRVILTGHRRQYVISELKKRNIKYDYFENIELTQLNELYNCLDLYIVSSRIEGGPFSILESSAAMIPVISTNVGIANTILSKESIYTMSNYKEAKPNVTVAYSNTKNLFIPKGMESFKQMFEKVIYS